jgi:integral membrane protein (TIGR01906 family)
MLGFKKTLADKLLSVVFALALALAVVTFSIGLPIYFRPFYYMQIEPLEIEKETSESKEDIKAAYDELLDYLTLPNRNFGTGVFPYSESGKSHFDDCKVLFDLNAAVFTISFAVFFLILLLAKKKAITLWRPFGFNICFFTGIFTLGLFAILTVLVSLNFNTAFKVFHLILFPGKDNWIFNYNTDKIILALPNEFFINCAVLIVSSIVLVCIALIIYGALKKSDKFCK